MREGRIHIGFTSTSKTRWGGPSIWLESYTVRHREGSRAVERGAPAVDPPAGGRAKYVPFAARRKPALSSVHRCLPRTLHRESGNEAARSSNVEADAEVVLANGRAFWNRRLTWAALLAVGVACLATACSRERPCDPKAGRAKLDFTLKDMNGHDVQLTAYRGRPLVINFWATWCGPCKEEIPALVQLVDQYKSSRLAVLGISI